MMVKEITALREAMRQIAWLINHKHTASYAPTRLILSAMKEEKWTQ